MPEKNLFILADTALYNTISRIQADQWSMTMPADFATSSGEMPTMRQVINYHAYDEAWVPDVLAGRTMADVGEDAFQGDLLGDDPVMAYQSFLVKATQAVNNLTDLDQTAHLSYGDYPIREYLWHVTSFRGFRAYDIAKAIGADSTLPEELVQGMWDVLSPHAEEWRAMGIYGPRMEVAEDAPLQDRLLGMSGRQP